MSSSLSRCHRLFLLALCDTHCLTKPPNRYKKISLRDFRFECSVPHLFLFFPRDHIVSSQRHGIAVGRCSLGFSRRTLRQPKITGHFPSKRLFGGCLSCRTCYSMRNINRYIAWLWRTSWNAFSRLLDPRWSHKDSRLPRVGVFAFQDYDKFGDKVYHERGQCIDTVNHPKKAWQLCGRQIILEDDDYQSEENKHEMGVHHKT